MPPICQPLPSSPAEHVISVFPSRQLGADYPCSAYSGYLRSASIFIPLLMMACLKRSLSHFVWPGRISGSNGNLRPGFLYITSISFLFSLVFVANAAHILTVLPTSGSSYPTRKTAQTGTHPRYGHVIIQTKTSRCPAMPSSACLAPGGANAG